MASKRLIGLLVLAVGFFPDDISLGQEALPNCCDHLAKLTGVLVNSKDNIARRSAAFAIGKMGRSAERAVPDLVNALSDKDEGVRESVAQALGQIGPKAAVAIPSLICCLEDASKEVRLASIQALGEFGAKAGKAVPSLIKLRVGDIAGRDVLRVTDLGSESPAKADPKEFQTEVS